MKRSEIKVGAVYGVRLSLGSDATAVPAKVVALDEPYPYRASRWGGENGRSQDGGIRVRFVKPTRVGIYNFSLGKDTNEHAGPVIEEYVFGDKRNGGAVGKCFVGVWAEMEAERKAGDRAQREADEQRERQADEFEPVLATYRARLRKLGIRTEVYGDFSGVHGDVDMRLLTTGYRANKPVRAVGFAYDDVRIEKALFDQLVEIAERHGEKVKAKR